jgi:hypothetical protein
MVACLSPTFSSTLWKAHAHLSMVWNGIVSCLQAFCNLLWQWHAFHYCATCILMKQHCSYLLSMFLRQFHVMPNASHQYTSVRFQVLTVASMKMACFWVVVPCSLVEIYQRFRSACCLLLPDYMVQQPRRQPSSLYIT